MVSDGTGARLTTGRREAEEGQGKVTTVARDQFEIQGRQVTHVPTGASFTVGSKLTNWGSAGEVLPNGDIFERKDILHIAMQIVREMPDK